MNSWRIFLHFVVLYMGKIKPMRKPGYNVIHSPSNFLNSLANCNPSGMATTPNRIGREGMLALDDGLYVSPVAESHMKCDNVPEAG